VAPTQPIQWLSAFFHGFKAAEGAEVKKEWSCTSNPHIYLHGDGRDDLSSSLLLLILIIAIRKGVYISAT
jgi:hypothetical protein